MYQTRLKQYHILHFQSIPIRLSHHTPFISPPYGVTLLSGTTTVVGVTVKEGNVPKLVILGTDFA